MYNVSTSQSQGVQTMGEYLYGLRKLPKVKVVRVDGAYWFDCGKTPFVEVGKVE